LGINARNKIPIDMNPRDLPIELFGMPDCLPIVYCATHGNPNNHRVSLYSKVSRQLLIGLYRFSKQNVSKLETIILEDYSDIQLLYHPTYGYSINNPRLKRIKKNIGCTMEEAEDFWNKHITYTMTKPKETNHFKKWLKCMYFNKSFTQAYVNIGRAQLSLRLSYFTSKPCVNMEPISGKHGDYIDIKKYIAYIYGKCSELGKDPIEQQEVIWLEKIITNGNTNIQAFYSMANKCKIIPRSDKPLNRTVSLLPTSYEWLQLANNISVVLMYTINFEDFLINRVQHNGLSSLEKDSKKIKEMYKLDDTNIKDPNYLRLIFRDISMQNNTPNIGITFKDSLMTYEQYVKVQLENNIFDNRKYKVIIGGLTEVKHPITQELIFQRDWRYINDLDIAVIEELTLVYHLLKTKLKYDIDTVKKFIMEINVTTGGRKICDLLDNITFNNLRQKNANEFQLRSAVFLKRVLTEDSKELGNYMKDKGTVIHSYSNRNIKDTFIEKVSFKYVNNDYIAYTFLKNKNQYSVVSGDILMYGVKVNDQVGKKTELSKDQNYTLLVLHTKSRNVLQNVCAYYIAMKLMNIITSEKLLYKLANPTLIDTIQIPDEILPNIVGNRLPKIFIIDNGIITLNNYLKDQPTIPIFITDVITISHKIHKLDVSMPYTIDMDNSSVYLRSIKVFTLPFFSNGHYGLLKCNNDLSVDGVRLSSLVGTKLLWDYMNNDHPDSNYRLGFEEDDIMIEPQEDKLPKLEMLFDRIDVSQFVVDSIEENEEPHDKGSDESNIDTKKAKDKQAINLEELAGLPPSENPFSSSFMQEFMKNMSLNEEDESKSSSEVSQDNRINLDMDLLGDGLNLEYSNVSDNRFTSSNQIGNKSETNSVEDYITEIVKDFEIPDTKINKDLVAEEIEFKVHDKSTRTYYHPEIGTTLPDLENMFKLTAEECTLVESNDIDNNDNSTESKPSVNKEISPFEIPPSNNEIVTPDMFDSALEGFEIQTNYADITSNMRNDATQDNITGLDILDMSHITGKEFQSSSEAFSKYCNEIELVSEGTSNEQSFHSSDNENVPFFLGSKKNSYGTYGSFAVKYIEGLMPLRKYILLHWVGSSILGVADKFKSYIFLKYTYIRETILSLNKKKKSHPIDKNTILALEALSYVIEDNNEHMDKQMFNLIDQETILQNFGGGSFNIIKGVILEKDDDDLVDDDPEVRDARVYSLKDGQRFLGYRLPAKYCIDVISSWNIDMLNLTQFNTIFNKLQNKSLKKTKLKHLKKIYKGL